MFMLYSSVHNTRCFCNSCMYTLYTMHVLMVIVQMHQTHTSQIQHQYVSRVLCMCAKESMTTPAVRMLYVCECSFNNGHTLKALACRIQLIAVACNSTHASTHTHRTTHMHTCTRAHNNITACDAYTEVRVLRMLLSSDDVMNKYATFCPRPPSLTRIRKFTHVDVNPRLRACVCACMHACLCVIAHIVQYTPLTDT
jgi:hypothetical protein